MEGPSKAQVADILERAADLYESEQINWCKGAWGIRRLNIDGIPTPGQFHCAEGAVLRAAGYTMNQIIDAQRSQQERAQPLGVDILVQDPMVRSAFRAVSDHMGWIAPGPPKLWHYNDTLDELEPEEAKRSIITAFKETAKELRNGERRGYPGHEGMCQRPAEQGIEGES